MDFSPLSPDFTTSIGSSELTEQSTCYWKDVWRKLHSMRKTWQLCDVILYSDEGLMFKAHSIVLAASSSVFNAHLVDGSKTFMQKLSTSEHHLHGVTANVLQVTLDFIYGVAPETIVDFKRLQKGADSLGISAASSFCRQQLNELETLAKGGNGESQSKIEAKSDNHANVDKGFDEYETASPSRAQDLLSQCPYLRNMPTDSKANVPLKKRFLMKVLSQLKEEESPSRCCEQKAQVPQRVVNKTSDVNNIKFSGVVSQSKTVSKGKSPTGNINSESVSFNTMQENEQDLIDVESQKTLFTASEPSTTVSSSSNIVCMKTMPVTSSITLDSPQYQQVSQFQLFNTPHYTSTSSSHISQNNAISLVPKTASNNHISNGKFHHQPDFSDLVDIPHPIPDLVLGDMVPCPHLQRLVGKVDSYTGIPIDVITDDEDGDPNKHFCESEANGIPPSGNITAVSMGKNMKYTSKASDVLDVKTFGRDNAKSEPTERPMNIPGEIFDKVSPLAYNTTNNGNVSSDSELSDWNPEVVASTVANLIRVALNTDLTNGSVATEANHNSDDIIVGKHNLYKVSPTTQVSSMNFGNDAKIIGSGEASSCEGGINNIEMSEVKYGHPPGNNFGGKKNKKRDIDDGYQFGHLPLGSDDTAMDGRLEDGGDSSPECVNIAKRSKMYAADVKESNDIQHATETIKCPFTSDMRSGSIANINKCPFSCEALDLSSESAFASTGKFSVNSPNSVSVPTHTADALPLNAFTPPRNMFSDTLPQITNVSFDDNGEVSVNTTNTHLSSWNNGTSVHVQQASQMFGVPYSKPGNVKPVLNVQCNITDDINGNVPHLSLSKPISNDVTSKVKVIKNNQTNSFNGIMPSVKIKPLKNELSIKSEDMDINPKLDVLEMDTLSAKDRTNTHSLSESTVSPVSSTSKSVFCMDHVSDNSNHSSSSHDTVDTFERSPEVESKLDNQTIFSKLKDRSYVNPDGKKIFRCVAPGCEYNNKSIEYVQSHLYHRHGYGKPEISCNLCPRLYFSESQLKTHMKQTHDATAKQRQHPCEDCKETFKTSQSLHMHQLKVHGKGKLFSCEDCAFKSPRKKDLQGHMISQHRKAPPGVRIYECQYCNYKCIDKNRFSEHEASHTQERSFKCEYCGNYYATRRGLRNHMKYHSEDRPHVCEICKATFKVRAKLRDHTRLLHVQKGEKPYKCGHCDFRASVRGNVNQHIRNVHKGQPIQVIDMMKEQRTHVKAYDYANLKGNAIEEIKDASAAGYASVGNIGENSNSEIL